MVQLRTRAGLRPWGAVVRVAWQFVAGAPLPVLTQFVLRGLNAARPGLSTFVTAGFVNALVKGEGLPVWVAAFGGVALMEIFTDLLSQPVQNWVQAAATVRVQHRVLACAAGAPLIRHLDPAFHDQLALANRDLVRRLALWFDSLMYTIHSLVATAGLLATVLALGGGVALAGMVAIGSVVGLLVQGPMSRLEVTRSQRLARPRRIAEAWSGLLSKREAAPELRLFNLQAWVHERWAEAYRACAAEDLQAARGRLIWDGVRTVAALGSYVAVVVLAAAAARSVPSDQAAGVFTGLVLAGQAMQAFSREVLSSVGLLHQNTSIIHDLAALFAETREGEADVQPTVMDRPVPVALELVSFRYPAAASDTLRCVSAAIAPGEVVALVGPNGAGKSTLAALILGLYQPADGRVLAGQSGDYGRPRGSAVFQDFARYSLPVRDNVGFGNLERREDEVGMQAALLQAGSNLEEELDTWLGAEFGGRDLSGGEWLRVAIARGIFRGSGLIVLDEPTAAIDPLTEVELVRRLLSVGKGRTAIVVSHRLGIARMADRILVMDEGRIVEQGTHGELLAAGGLYDRMWRAQAAWYTDLPEALRGRLAATLLRE